MSKQARIELTESIEDMYIPLDYVATIYTSIYHGIRSAYKGRTQVVLNRQLAAVGAAIEYKRHSSIPDFPSQAKSFSVLGESGMGKTRTLDKVFGLIPQVITHTQYKGKEYRQVQITYLRIESPANNSPRGACAQILSEIDMILGTTMVEEVERKACNIDMLISKIAQVCLRFNIGIIVIDEIQNIITVKSKKPSESSVFVRFLVELSNKTGVCLVCVGTPKVAPFFDAEPHLARRTRGPRIAALEEEKAFNEILTRMWNRLAVLNPQPLTASLRKQIYRITGGSLESMGQLLVQAGIRAIALDRECIDEDNLRSIAQDLGIVARHTYVQAKSPVLLFDAPNTIRQAEATKNSDMKAPRGRPKVNREEEDLLIIFDSCKNSGMSVAKRLLYMNIAMEVVYDE